MLLETLWSRVSTIIGDLDQPRLALDDHQWRQLKERVNLVVHCGAKVFLFFLFFLYRFISSFHSLQKVNSVLPYDALRDSNILSTLELLKFAIACNQSRSMQFVFVSYECSTHSTHSLLFLSRSFFQYCWCLFNLSSYSI
jgi:thioester reductase-like protein